MKSNNHTATGQFNAAQAIIIMMEVNQSILSTIGNTPLVRINSLNPNDRVEMYAKIEGVNPTGSIKDRIALSMIDQAEKSGALTREKQSSSLLQVILVSLWQ